MRCIARDLSTNHFCYPGYWIWFIPLARGATSVGVVAEASASMALRTAEGFLAFLRSHRAVPTCSTAPSCSTSGLHAARLRDAALLLGERWALLGDAAAFTDPFYSPGSDFIALEYDS